MKVKELIVELSECNPELDVLLLDNRKFVSPHCVTEISLSKVDTDMIERDSLDLILETEAVDIPICLIM